MDESWKDEEKGIIYGDESEAGQSPRERAWADLMNAGVESVCYYYLKKFNLKPDPESINDWCFSYYEPLGDYYDYTGFHNLWDLGFFGEENMEDDGFIDLSKILKEVIKLHDFGSTGDYFQSRDKEFQYVRVWDLYLKDQYFKNKDFGVWADPTRALQRYASFVEDNDNAEIYGSNWYIGEAWRVDNNGDIRIDAFKDFWVGKFNLNKMVKEEEIHDWFWIKRPLKVNYNQCH